MYSVSVLAIVVAGTVPIAMLGRRDWRLLALNGLLLALVAGHFLFDRTDRSTAWNLVMLAGIVSALAGINLVVARRSDNLRQALTELGVREERLAQAAGLAKLGYYYYDTVLEQVVDCTEQHARSHGQTREEYLRLASTLSNEMPLVHPDDRDLLRAKYREVLEGKQVEVQYRVPTDRGTIHVREITQPVFDDNGQVIAEIGTTMDISAQVVNEHQLLLSQKLETAGKIAAGVAHDFNNVLGIILLNLETLALHVDSPRHTQMLQHSIEAVDRGSSLAKSLLSFARQADLRPQVFNLNDLVRKTRQWSGGVLPPTIDVEVSLLAGLWPIHADPGLAENAILNLILNARDAMPTGGKLTLETANVRVDQDYLDSRDETFEVGRYAMLAISDTGSGIDPQALDQIFEPFYTTKPSGAGSGLGLSMVVGFMKQSGGTIRVYSEPSEGTSFQLYFPAADIGPDGGHFIERSPEIAGAASDNAAPLARLLLAEDEDGIRLATSAVLEQAGYEVVAAASGDAAYEILVDDPGFDLLVTDIVMPGQRNGPQLARDARVLNPDLPVIFLSGYPAEATVHGNGLRPSDLRLQKPFRSRELTDAVERLLERHRRTGGR